MKLRILLLLVSSGKNNKYSLDRIVSLDFITCYAGEFQMPYENLHGVNSYMYGELTNRRLKFQDAMKEAVVSGLVNVTVEDGYKYSISKDGMKFIKNLRSDYSTEYKMIATDVINVFKKSSDLELDVMIHDNATKAIKWREDECTI